MKCKWHSMCYAYLTFAAQPGKEKFRKIPKHTRKIAVKNMILSSKEAEMLKEGLSRGCMQGWPCHWLL